MDIAFPASVLHLMPAYEDIPAEYRDMNGRTTWQKLVTDWFFRGVRDLRIDWRDGIDSDKALRHIKCILGSFEPKHEHKEASVAYLLSLWATDAKWKAGKVA